MYTFSDATSFNQPLNNWDVSNVQNMGYMFSSASSFNQPLNNWDVSKVTTMAYMFWDASSFNQPINSWDVSKVTTMAYMFWDASSFNQSLNSWNVSKVTTMAYMFWNAFSFNQPLDKWNVSSIKNMDFMFWDAIKFNQLIGDWIVGSVISMNGMFSGVSLSTEIYDDLLIKWANQPLQINVLFDGGNSKYSSNAENSRKVLLNDYHWTILDGGIITVPYPPIILDIKSNNGYITLIWSEPTSNGGSKITNYTIYRTLTSGENYELLAVITESTLTYTDILVINGKTYFYIIKAVNNVGESLASEEVFISLDFTSIIQSTTLNNKTIILSNSTILTNNSSMFSLPNSTNIINTTMRFELFSLLNIVGLFVFVKRQLQRKKNFN
jgi:surface protein